MVPETWKLKIGRGTKISVFLWCIVWLVTGNFVFFLFVPRVPPSRACSTLNTSSTKHLPHMQTREEKTAAFISQRVRDAGALKHQPWMQYWSIFQGKNSKNTIKASIIKQCAVLAVMEEYSSQGQDGNDYRTAQLEGFMRDNVPEQVKKLHDQGEFFPGVTYDMVMGEMPKNYWERAIEIARDIKREALPLLAKAAPGGALPSGLICADIFHKILSQCWADKEQARFDAAQSRASATDTSGGIQTEGGSPATGVARVIKPPQPMPSDYEGPLWFVAFLKFCVIGVAPMPWCAAETSASRQVGCVPAPFRFGCCAILSSVCEADFLFFCSLPLTHCTCASGWQHRARGQAQPDWP